MKHLTTVLLVLTLTINCFSQKKDTTLISDTTAIITWSDIQTTINSLYGKVEKEDYDKAQTLYQILWNNAIERRRKKK